MVVMAIVEHHNNIPKYAMKIILELSDVIVEVVGAFHLSIMHVDFLQLVSRCD